jgi:prepilin-type N-terminal cleavage/methylation domain-containing protein
MYLKNPTQSKQSGFTLIECVIAIVLILVGLLAVFSLVVYSVKTQSMSRDLVTANSLARQKIEELKNATRTAGGSLTANTNGYYDNPSSSFIRRWQISSDSVGTQTVSVTVVPSIPNTLMPEVALTTKMR